MAKKLAIVLAVILAILIGIYANAGGFAKVTIVEENFDGITIAAVYLEGSEISAKGDVKNTKMDELRKKLLDLKIHDDSTAKYVSISYRDTSKNKEGLSAFVSGFLLTKEAAVKVATQAPEIPLITIEPMKIHVSRFKQKGVLSLLIGIQKQYKAMNKFCIKNNISTESPTINIINFENGMNAYILPEEAAFSKLQDLCDKVKNWKAPVPEKSAPPVQDSTSVDSTSVTTGA